ncbi:MAG: hypothetical protein J6E40_03685 [Lachnospiraceae bacterium]|nr:hypothetical protein [Lachnospiraceae bacterium]MBQ8330415.1 hypothetical protein [Lachnospiraceae bacterium]
MDERQKQVLFLKRLRDTADTAAKNGNMITEEELEEAFADLDLNESQMTQVRDFLKTKGVGIGEALPIEEVISEEEMNHLRDYEEMLDSIEIPSDSVLDALKLSAMAGERDAQKSLAEYSLKKVVDIARLYAGQGVYMEDLIGAGNEVLLIAVTQLAPLDKPDEVDGYLGRRIMDAMEDVIAANLDEKAAEKVVEERVNLVADRAREMAEELGRKVSVAELAAEYDMDPEDIREAVRLSGNAIGDIQ